MTLTVSRSAKYKRYQQQCTGKSFRDVHHASGFRLGEGEKMKFMIKKAKKSMFSFCDIKPSPCVLQSVRGANE